MGKRIRSAVPITLIPFDQVVVLHVSVTLIIEHNILFGSANDPAVSSAFLEARTSIAVGDMLMD